MCNLIFPSPWEFRVMLIDSYNFRAREIYTEKPRKVDNLPNMLLTKKTFDLRLICLLNFSNE